MDRSDEKDSPSIDLGRENRAGAAIDGSGFPNPKHCTDCQTTKTPLWRGGPSGPKSLCNACGIKYRKRRRELLGEEGPVKGKSKGTGSKVGVVRLLGPGKDVLFKEGMVLQWKQGWLWRQLGEEEKAAVLLMALSSSPVEDA